MAQIVTRKNESRKGQLQHPNPNFAGILQVSKPIPISLKQTRPTMFRSALVASLIAGSAAFAPAARPASASSALQAASPFAEEIGAQVPRAA